MIAYRNDNKTRNVILNLIKKNQLKKNETTGEYELTNKGIKKLNKAKIRLVFIGTNNQLEKDEKLYQQ